MQRRLYPLFGVGRHGACYATVTLLTLRGAGTQCPSGSEGCTENEDPAAVLRQLQKDIRRRAAEDAPPALRRRSGKATFFAEMKPSQENPGEECNGATRITDPPKEEADPLFKKSGRISPINESGAKKTTPNAFLQKLSKMESDSHSPSFPTYNAAAEERRKKIEGKIKAERSKMLIFRDVGMDLDKPILSRDVFLVFKYFRYGTDFAVDNELERMLRYFNEHATNELKIIQDSKLMRGPPHLSRKRRKVSRQKSSSSLIKGTPTVGSSSKVNPAEQREAAASLHQQGLQFQISSSFPRVRCANTRQFCLPNAFSATVASKLAALLSFSNSSSSFASYFPPVTVPETHFSGGKSYNTKDSELFTTITPSLFRRPAVVIFSQLGQKFGSQADADWRRLAYASICPGLLPYLPSSAEEMIMAKCGVTETRSPSAIRRSGIEGMRDSGIHASPPSRAMPIDVISLRSADVYTFSWVQRLYVRQFAKSLSREFATQLGGVSSANEVHRALIASSTFVGSQLLEPFYASLGLRNYLLPHVMLVDHEGVIRWLSGGLPDVDEKTVFPSLLQQLESEYLMASK